MMLSANAGTLASRSSKYFVDDRRAMISDVAVEEARAISLRAIVSRDITLKRAGKYWQGSCPFHQERTPSFYVMPDDRRFKCFGCGAAGDAIEYLRKTRGLDFQSAVAQLASSSGSSGMSRASSRPPPQTAAVSLLEPVPNQVHELWAGADAPNIAEFYLRSRRLLRYGTLPAALRGHNHVLYAEACGTEKPLVEPSWRTWRGSDGQWWKAIHKPAMLATITDPQDQITALQRIWCETRYEVDASRSGPQDARAKGLVTRKKTLGRIGAGAIRLAEPEETLGLAEGVESAMAAAQLFRYPVWALAGVTRMGAAGRNGSPDRAPAIWLPHRIRHLYIFGDRGDAGERAADFCAWWYRRQGLDARAVLPSESYDDWNSELLGTLR